MGAVADGGGHACTVGPSRTGPRKGTAPLMPPTCTLGSRASCGQPVVLLSSGRMHGRHGTAGATLLSRGQNAGTKGWSQPRAKPGQLGGGPTSWGPGAQCHHRAPDARRGARTTWGIVFAHSLLSPPLPGWRMPQAWADVACSPKHTHMCPFGPRHQQEERGSWRKGRRPLPREGALPTLGVRAYMTVHCRASCRPAHFVILAWALTCGCRWLSAAPGLAHSLELTRGLCVRLAGLRLTEDFPSWFGGGPAPWQETANIVH